MSLAVRLLLLGLLVIVGTTATSAVAGLTPPDAVPVCCQRRVRSFARRARVIALAGVLAVLAGTALLER